FNNFLKRSGLYNKNYPLRGDNRKGTFYVSGPPVYVDMVVNAAMPCLSVEQLKQWGVKTENFPELKNDPNGCTDLSLLAGAVAKFN
ncbi:hypothetical protein MJM95_27760, partial [Salmonella enterica subsp. enterica serovar Anatum]|nr:hypothetical protein [Salmonella enterica subsp. enterica serovar Anatum]